MDRNILLLIRKELKKKADKTIRAGAKRFFKEDIKCHGIKTAVVRCIAKDAFRQIREYTKDKIFGLCEELLKSDYMEESLIAFDWAYRMRKYYEPRDFKTFERWVELYINNWAKCDTFCNHSVGAFVELYPEYLRKLKLWARSSNRWMRRASAVTLIIPAAHGKFLEEVFDLADILLTDDDDMAQKGYGWMLKAASQAHQRKVFDYVIKNKKSMPRTALRYAIEKMPTVLKAQAMAKQR